MLSAFTLATVGINCINGELEGNVSRQDYVKNAAIADASSS